MPPPPPSSAAIRLHPRKTFSSSARLVVVAPLILLLVQLSTMLAETANAAELARGGLAPQVALGPPTMDGQGPPASTMNTLIDWRTYTRTFNKKYSSLTQQIVRNKLFILNTMKVFLTATKYRFKSASYYLVINRFSDMTPQEEQNKLAGDGGQYSTGDDEAADDEDAIMDDEQIARILQADLEGDQPDGDEQQDGGLAVDSKRSSSSKSQPTKATLKRRRKRATDAPAVDSSGQRPDMAQPPETQQHNQNGRLDVADLIRIPDVENDQSLAYSGPNIKWLVPSNNPDYVPVETDTIMSPIIHQDQSTGAQKRVGDVPKEQMKHIDEATAQGWLTPGLNSLSSFTKNAYDWISSSSPASLNGEPTTTTTVTEQPEVQHTNGPSKAPESSDVVIKDWRTSGCIGTPYDQGDCNSCYAVSSMSFMEWAFCMNQDRLLTPLSAQYFVSCGPQFMDESDPRLKIEFYGCDKGRSRQAMYFVKEYGVELAAHMPYLAEDTGCPIEPNTPLKHKGYIRPNVKQHVRMSASTKQLELALNVGPVIVNFREPIDFMAFGGGMVGDCHQRGGHAMLVVGHGIENDKRYLIIKNSFGSDWGMNGYFKFDRDFTQACIKDFILPRVSFPSKKSQVRRMKAYDASKTSVLAEEANDFEIHLNKLADY